MIISLCYRVKSRIATNSRCLATERLKGSIIKGFTSTRWIKKFPRHNQKNPE
ncbi:MAG: virulence RhuM family protein [Muribaculaceae bacterium]|nr:virulence RhuM family protein [Muribaculaceae bacterium]MCM1399341.1 virulence RhuM family protein [Clostridium sp.]MCM1460618.1 virulence RhuM family protein [Bacteroides sp.]